MCLPGETLQQKKPVVHYTGEVEFYRAWTGKEHAQVYGLLDHPLIGKARVAVTSEVLVKCEDGLSFETVNTIYKKEEAQPDG